MECGILGKLSLENVGILTSKEMILSNVWILLNVIMISTLHQSWTTALMFSKRYRSNMLRSINRIGDIHDSYVYYQKISSTRSLTDSRCISTLNTNHDDSSTVGNQGGYNGNPCIHFTSLAHLQWEHILRPGIDSAIDATCGNGKDSCHLASILFPPTLADPGMSELLCLDIQPTACDVTRKALLTLIQNQKLNIDPIHLSSMTKEKEETISHIRVLEQSHCSLPNTKSPLALVCWNLGYLPQSNDKSTLTTMESTVASIADAALKLRVGGLLSVMTYPMTNRKEDFAARSLLEGLAIISSRQINWRDYLSMLGPDPSEYPSNIEQMTTTTFSVQTTVCDALTRVIERGNPNQTWRTMEHRMLGRPFSPILVTATRVK
jgi:Putative rRNA methylase